MWPHLLNKGQEILGPLLFSLFINDLPEVLRAQTNLFADDGAMYESGSDLEEVRNTLNVNMKVLETWLDENELELNTKKIRVMYLGSSASKCNDNESGVQFHGTPLAMCQQFKYLGVMVNNALNWNDHIGMITLEWSSRILQKTVNPAQE